MPTSGCRTSASISVSEAPHTPPDNAVCLNFSLFSFRKPKLSIDQQKSSAYISPNRQFFGTPCSTL
ncbi:hypothetical protein CT19431_MP100134 [Cupriavidus taiwanensis]|nr:hypothetical protein CT19431_MP100134 [Cupriavidus taiwanensis]